MSDQNEVCGATLPADLDRLLHDLRGPLNAAVMHLEVLKRVLAEDPTAQASVQSVHAEVERLARMLQAAFAIAAIEPGARRRLSLRAVVQAAVDDIKSERVVVEPGAWPDVDGDGRLLMLGVQQLVHNALEARAETPVHLGVEPGDDGRVSVVVRDQGRGFKSSNPNAIVRLMASTKPGHLGIGLLVAQRVARLHGGTLAFQTSSDGAIVRLTLSARAAA